MAIATAVVGAVVLLFGRQANWLFVGVIGFLLGANLAGMIIGEGSTLAIVISAVTGLSGVLMAALMHKLALDAAGFVASGYALTGLIGIIGLDVGDLSWLIFLIGGVLGALMVLTWSNWALIILSSFTAAYLILGTFNVTPPLDKFAYIGLVLLGLAVQSAMLQRDESSPEPAH
jgi:uncharacterized membrane protein YuzA (DUF378 family)